MGKRLSGKTAIITGGASGIGKGIARCMASEGANIAIFDKDVQGAKHVATEIEGQCPGQYANVSRVDVTNEDDIKHAVAEVLEAFGKIDILVNNAGIEGAPGNPFILNTEEDWDAVWKTNAKSVFLVSKAVVPHFMERKTGCIINISSVAALMPGPMSPPYTVSKAAVNSMTQTFAIQLASYGIRVNALAPGLVWTPHWERLAKGNIEKYPDKFGDMTPREVYEQRFSEVVPLQQEQTPEDVGKATVFLASDDARCITGQVLAIDGGVLVKR